MPPANTCLLLKTACSYPKASHQYNYLNCLKGFKVIAVKNTTVEGLSLTQNDIRSTVGQQILFICVFICKYVAHWLANRLPQGGRLSRYDLKHTSHFKMCVRSIAVVMRQECSDSVHIFINIAVLKKYVYLIVWCSICTLPTKFTCNIPM